MQADIPGQAIIDGEVVFLKDGRTNFSELQAELAARRQDRLLYYAFDLLYLDGHVSCNVVALEKLAQKGRAAAHGSKLTIAKKFGSTEKSKALHWLRFNLHSTKWSTQVSASILKSFTFVPQPKLNTDPLVIKRERMVSRLEDQKKLLADPSFVRQVKRWERKENGERVLIEKPLRTSKWWQPDQNGTYLLTVKVGSKRIEFEKGKEAIVVGSLDKLPAVIDTLIKAVRAGELDEQLNQSGKSSRPIPPRKAA